MDPFFFPSSPPWADRASVIPSSVSCGRRKTITHLMAKTKSAGVRDHTELILTIWMWHTFVSVRNGAESLADVSCGMDMKPHGSAYNL